MNFSGEPEIAVLRQETFATGNYAPSPAAAFDVVGAPVMCGERLWAVTARTNGLAPSSTAADHALAIETEDEVSKMKTFEDVISFPPPSSLSASGAPLNAAAFEKRKKFTTVTRRFQKQQSSSSPSSSGGSSKTLIISIRHFDGIFLIADADTGRPVGTGTLQLDPPPPASDPAPGEEEQNQRPQQQQQKNNNNGNNMVQTAVVDDRSQNTVIIFATTKQQVGEQHEDCLSVMQLVVGSDPETRQPQLHVVLSAVIPQPIVVNAACLDATVEGCMALALDGCSVELWARSVLLQQQQRDNISDGVGGGVDDRCTSIASNENNDDLVRGRCTYDAAKVGIIGQLCKDESGMQMGKLFGCTDRGFCLVFSIQQKKKEEGGSSNSNSNSHLSSPAAAMLSIRVLKVISVTDSPLTSAMCACSTLWFADTKGNVRIWSLESLEELGTLDSSVESGEKNGNGGGGGIASVIPITDLEFRQNLGVFRSGSLQSLAVKQPAAPAVPPSVKSDNVAAQENKNPNDEQKSTPTKNSRQHQQPSSPSPAKDGRSPSNSSKASSSASPSAGASATSTSSRQKQQDAALSGPQANAAALSFIRQLCDVLARPSNAPGNSPTKSSSGGSSKKSDSPPRVAVPDRVARAVPEASYLEAALQSVAQSSGTIARSLPQLGLKPSTLTQDVGSVCDIAVRLYRTDAKLKQALDSLEQQVAPQTPAAADGENGKENEKKDSSSSSTKESDANLQQRGGKYKKSNDANNSSSGAAERKEEGAAAATTLPTTDRLIAICQKLAVKHDNEMVKLTAQMEELEQKKQIEIDAVEKRRAKEVGELKAKLEKSQQQLLALKAQQQNQRAAAAPASSRRHVDANSSSATGIEQQQDGRDEAAKQEEEEDLDPQLLKRKVDKLSTELRSKSTLVKHLMQLTNDNGRVIEEMRAHAVQRRDECVELRRVVREMNDHHTAIVDGTVFEIDRMLSTFSSPQSTTTSNLRSVSFMLQNLKAKLQPNSP